MAFTNGRFVSPTQALIVGDAGSNTAFTIKRLALTGNGADLRIEAGQGTSGTGGNLYLGAASYANNQVCHRILVPLF